MSKVLMAILVVPAGLLALAVVATVVAVVGMVAFQIGQGLLHRSPWFAVLGIGVLAVLGLSAVAWWHGHPRTETFEDDVRLQQQQVELEQRQREREQRF